MQYKKRSSYIMLSLTLVFYILEVEVLVKSSYLHGGAIVYI